MAVESSGRKQRQQRQARVPRPACQAKTNGRNKKAAVHISQQLLVSFFNYNVTWLFSLNRKLHCQLSSTQQVNDRGL